MALPGWHRLQGLVLILAIAALSTALATSNPPRATPNDNRTPAGQLQDGQLSLRLEIRMATWLPEGEHSSSVDVLAFAEVGALPSIPGPLVRVAEGTTIEVSIHNTLADTMYVFGLHTRPATSDAAPLQLLPGQTRTLTFPAGASGTYFYWASSTPDTGLARAPAEAQLNGAWIIDPLGELVNDRVFLMSISPFRVADQPRIVMTINGRSFPHTERTEYMQNDTVHWRVINATNAPHPMHMHGFYYQVASAGTYRADRGFERAEQKLVVTEHMRPGGTMRIRFVPHEPGFWAFHCHFAFHSGGHLGLKPHEEYGTPAQARHQMGGLVLVYYVKPLPFKASADQPRPRALRVLVRESADTTHARQRMAFLLDTTGTGAAAFALPSSPLFLRRGERVAITVVNQLREPTQIHWHGIELESYPDGIAGISGMPGRLTPAIQPRDSFTAVFTPPRAGTFIYHAHMNDAYQINLGLYGALIVLDADSIWRPERDHIVLAGGGGRLQEEQAIGLVNGTYVSAPMDMRVGETHRIRLISIHPDNELQFALLSSGGELMRWRAVAKDGADLPPGLRKMLPAYLMTGPGETADFEFTPEVAGNYRLEVKAPDRHARGWYIPVPIQVR